MTSISCVFFDIAGSLPFAHFIWTELLCVAQCERLKAAPKAKRKRIESCVKDEWKPSHRQLVLTRNYIGLCSRLRVSLRETWAQQRVSRCEIVLREHRRRVSGVASGSAVDCYVREVCLSVCVFVCTSFILIEIFRGFFASCKLTGWLTDWLTDWPTTWSRVLSEKLTRPQLVQKFLAFYGTQMFITCRYA